MKILIIRNYPSYMDVEKNTLPELAAERKTGYCFSKCGRAGSGTI